MAKMASSISPRTVLHFVGFRDNHRRAFVNAVRGQRLIAPGDVIGRHHGEHKS